MLSTVHAQAELYFLKLGDTINLFSCSSHVETIDGRSLYFFYTEMFRINVHAD